MQTSYSSIAVVILSLVALGFGQQEEDPQCSEKRTALRTCMQREKPLKMQNMLNAVSECAAIEGGECETQATSFQTEMSCMRGQLQNADIGSCYTNNLDFTKIRQPGQGGRGGHGGHGGRRGHHEKKLRQRLNQCPETFFSCVQNNVGSDRPCQNEKEALRGLRCASKDWKAVCMCKCGKMQTAKTTCNISPPLGAPNVTCEERCANGGRRGGRNGGQRGRRNPF